MLPFLLSSLLAALPEAAPGHLYTLDELTQIALVNQPRLKAAAAEEQAARERKGEAEAPNYPSVDLYAEYVRATYNNSVSSYFAVPWLASIGGYSSTDLNRLPSFQGVAPPLPSQSFTASNDSYFLGAMAKYDVLDFGRTASGIRGAEAGIDLSRSDALVAAEAVVFGVRRAYYELLAAEALLTTAKKVLAEAQEHLAWAHEAVKDGLRAPVDEIQARSDVTRADLMLVQARAGVRVSRVRILRAIGLEEPRHIEVAPSPDAVDIGETEASLLDRAYRERPDLAALAARTRFTEARLANANANFNPVLNAEANLFAAGSDPNLPWTQPGLSAVPDWDVGLILSFPLFEGFLLTHQAREAQADVNVAKQHEEDLKLTVLKQVREAFVDFKAALEAVVAADANKAAAAEEMKVVSGRYNNGLSSILDLIIAQATSVTADQEAVRARYQAGIARSFLDLAVGEPPPRLAAAQRSP